MLTTKQNNVVAVIQLINANQKKVVKGRGVLKLVCDACVYKDQHLLDKLSW
jgi:hypothetical protein